MSRGFGTLGQGSADRLTSPAIEALITGQTWLVWVYRNEQNDGSQTVISHPAFGLTFGQDWSPSTRVSRATGFIPADISFGATANNTWTCFVFRFQGTSNPARIEVFDVFRDGALVASYPAGGGNQSADYWTTGASAATFGNNYLNALVGDTASWGALLTDEQIASLFAGANPSTIAPDNLIYYCPITGDVAPEPNYVPGMTDTLVTGTLKGATNPPVDPIDGEGGDDRTGAVVAVEARDTSAFAGVKSFTGVVAATEPRDASSMAGSVIPKFATGALAATELRDAYRSDGDVFTPGELAGGLVALEYRDTAAMSGRKTYVGTMAVSEPRDQAAFAGVIIPKFATGTLAATEPRDVALMDGDIFDPSERGGALRATETRDTGAFAGVKTFNGVLQALEALDRATIAGTATKRVNGVLAGTEVLDDAQFYDIATEEAIMGNTIALRDSNTGIGVSPEAPWHGGAPTVGDGTLIPVAIGQAPRADNMMRNTDNAVRQTRLLQALGDTPAGTDIIPGWFSFIDVKAGEWCWAVSRTGAVGENDNPIGMGDTTPVGSSFTTLGNAPAALPSPVTIEDEPDVYEFHGTVVHPEP